jgi:integrase
MLADAATSHAPLTQPSDMATEAPVQALASAVKPQENASLTELLDDFFVRKGIGDPKRQSQFRFTCSLLAIAAGTDNPAAITLNHVDRCRTLLDYLPRKSFGKSPKDLEKSYQQILDENAEKRGSESRLPEAQRTIGLLAGTINRHVGDLGAVAKFAEMKGYSWGARSQISEFRAVDTVRPDEKRGAFTIDQEIAIFNHPAWADLSQPVIPSLYFAPILAALTFARRFEIVGLRRRDVDIESKLIHIRPNGTRRVKTLWSERTLPIPQELIRLGFLDYMASLPQEPEAEIFRELKEIAPNANIADTFGDRFAAVLREVIPNARELSLTLTSFRHAGISWMETQDDIKSTVASYISGHFVPSKDNPSLKRRSVRQQHYIKEFAPDILRRALEKFPPVTAHIQPRNWNA